MNETNESTSSRSVGKVLIAGLVLLVCAYILLKLVIGLVLAIAAPVAVILAVVAIVWALKVLF